MDISQADRLRRVPRPAEIAGWSSDPRFYAGLKTLPNPDPIIRRNSSGEDVFRAIASDAHVKGELRSVRAGLLRFEHQLVAGGEDRASKKAFEICQNYLANSRPAPNYLWLDVFWNMGLAVFQGFSVHEIVPARFGDLIMPQKLVDRPMRRFRFEPGGESIRVITRENMIDGVEADQSLLLVARHMPSYDQPYGEALFSACYWPYVFKHSGGFPPFVKFCQRHGLPVPVGKYPRGTDESVIRVIEEALEALIEAGYVAMPDDASIELLEAKGANSGGKLAPHELIQLCNAEMSKALTSQTLATEQVNGGSRAASETHRARQGDVQEGDREIIAHTLDLLWEQITRWNVPGAKPPKSEFVEESEVRKERAETYEVALRSGLPVSKKGMAKELAIPLADPKDPDDNLQLVQKPAPVVPVPGATPKDAIAAAAAEFARGELDDAFPDQAAIDALQAGAAANKAMDQMLAPVMEAVRDGLPPEALRAQLAELYTRMDSSQLEQLLERAIFVSMVWGRISSEAERGDDA